MRVKYNFKKSVIFIAIVGVVAISVKSNLHAADGESGSHYTFTQTARVFDGENWNDVEKNADGSYSYYPAGSPDIVEFTINIVVNEETPTGIVKIKNSLPEGMEYVEDSLNIRQDGGYYNFRFKNDTPQSNKNRDLVLVEVDFSDGGGIYHFPGETATITFQARLLFDSGLCQNFISETTFSANTRTSVYLANADNYPHYAEVSNAIVDFISPCAGLLPLPLPDADPESEPILDPEPNLMPNSDLVPEPISDGKTDRSVRYIFDTKYKSTVWNWIMFFYFYGWIWMWF
ncbi:MAG: hypothetical protein LBJ67_13655 [Planctomycetaceae bacterium]|nr:hypothetical protein [Planctomycetaceae bacterium]